MDIQNNSQEAPGNPPVAVTLDSLRTGFNELLRLTRRVPRENRTQAEWSAGQAVRGVEFCEQLAAIGLAVHEANDQGRSA